VNIIYLENSPDKIAEINPSDTILDNLEDFIDLLGNANYQRAEKIIIYESNLNPEFFDLRTGIAGEVLQKFSNYGLKLAIIGDFDKFKSKSLKDFIRESNRTGNILFFNSREEALTKFSTDQGYSKN
jgi:hypothetical protein